MAKRDDNKVTTMQGVSSSDSSTPVNVVVDSVTGRVLLSAQSIANSSVTNREIAYRDGNKVPVMLGVSSADDGVLVQPVITSNNLRVKIV